jgi:glutamate racemase
MIENDQVDRHIIYTQIDEACKMNADVIVLGCTHYHWIEDLIKETANGRATILQPEPSVVAEVKQALAQLA